MSDSKSTPPENTAPAHFIRHIIREDLAAGKNGGHVVTRFPPEPNGFLHIGHAKSICLNFDLANEFNGRCHLRFDDTNPEKEETRYIDSIQRDVRWLGFDWGEHLYHAADYFEQLYQFAIELIENGKAFVCSLSAEQMREYRGTLTEPGQNSPDRARPIAENLDLFSRMKAGEFPDGAYVLRAKIDMAHPNINMRDPVLYRIRHVSHHRSGADWCIYPSYDFTHGISDALEGVTHSICTLEFADHKILYDWVLDNITIPCHPQQIEFSRLELNFTVTSKRKLNQLVSEGHVAGWDDPRMPTISGMRRRGYPPAAIHDFCNRIGVTRKVNLISLSLLETCVREALDADAKRVMAVLDPIKVVITNYPEDQIEMFECPYHPDGAEKMGTRQVPFSREIYIERDDFMEVPVKKYFRLAPGKEVRLRYAYYITCTDVIKNEQGEITELHCTYDPETRGGWAKDGRKVKGTLHWVSTAHAIPAQVNLYDRLFTVPNPSGDKQKAYLAFLNPDSLRVMREAKLEPSLANANVAEGFQFERLGYFCLDTPDGHERQADEPLVFNRTVSLRDSWAKIEKAGG
jgi:glutaminyl-tRNA synthetase